MEMNHEQFKTYKDLIGLAESNQLPVGGGTITNEIRNKAEKTILYCIKKVYIKENSYEEYIATDEAIKKFKTRETIKQINEERQRKKEQDNQ